MFGIKRLHRQRDRLYERTQRLEKQASDSRKQAKDTALDIASSPAGLIASFVMGATTQCDISKKARQNLLSGASKDVLSFLSTQVMAYMASIQQPDTSADQDDSDHAQAPQDTPHPTTESMHK